MVKGWKKRFAAVSLAVILGISMTPAGVRADESTPGVETPGTETPGTETPGTETPGTETPGTETPGTETPGTETPGTETPGTETPGTETPEEGTPEEEAPEVDLSFVNTSQALNMSDETLFTVDELGYITEYTGEEEEVVVPAVIDDVEIVGLRETFKKNKTVKKVYLPDSITVIGDKSFYGATSLSVVAYYRFTEGMPIEGVLEDVDMETTSAEVYEARFKNYVVFHSADGDEFCKIEEASGCACISEMVDLIGFSVFYNTGLVSFRVCPENPNYQSVGDVGLNQPEDVYGCLLSKDGKVLVCVAPNARYENDTLTYYLPEGIEEIAPHACSSHVIKEFVVPTSVTTIKAYAFAGCNGALELITFAEESSVTDIGDYAFSDNPNLDIKLPKSVKTLGAYVFNKIHNRTPDISETSIEEIPAYCFAGCENLHTITMPKSLRIIRGHAFGENDNLNEIIFLGDTLEKIESYAFADCQNLHKIDIPEGVTAIEDGTFSGCQNLNTIILPDSLESIGHESFADCNNIHELVIPPNVTEIAKDSFKGVENTDGIDTSENIYAEEAVTGKKLPKKGKKFTVGSLKYQVTKVAVTGISVKVTGVKSKSIASVKVGNTVKYKGYKCKITEIGGKAFRKCKKLKKVTIGKNVKKIGKQAFEGDGKLSSVTIKSTKLKSVGKNAIKGINKKAKITVPKSKFSKYKKYFKASTGFKKTMKIKKK